MTRAALFGTLALCATASCGDPAPTEAPNVPSAPVGADSSDATPAPAEVASVEDAASDADSPDEGPPSADASKPAADAAAAPRTPDDVLREPSAGPTADPDQGVPVAPALDAVATAALEAARALRSAGDRMGAVALLRAAETDRGDNAALRLEAAWCFFELAEEALRQNADKFLVKGNLADAHLRLDQALALQADLPTSAVLLAKLLRYEEDPKRARTVLEEHLARFPGDRLAHIELGDMAQNLRDWATADTHFSKAAALDHTDGRSRLNATIAKQWLTGEGAGSYTTEQLHAGYRMAARLLPEDNDPIRLLRGLYPNSRERQLAAFDELIEDNPSAIWARVWKAYVLRDAGPDGLARALDVLDEALRIAPESSVALVNRAETLALMERWNDAVAAYTDALLTCEPGTLGGASDALDGLLHVGAQAPKIPLAARDRAYDALCIANPAVGRFGNNAGLWYRDIGRDYEKSLEYYQKAVDANPYDQDYINDTALIYLFHLRDRKETSLPMFLRVIALVEEEGQEPIRGYWDALENLCKYYFEIGQYERVIYYSEKRDDGRANVNGTAYPSLRAAQYGNQARVKLAETE